MFNLLISHSGWQPNEDTLAGDRIFEYTDDTLAERLSLATKAGRDAVMELPTLFMAEGVGPKVAHTGRITKIRKSGRDYDLQYTFDTDMPPLANSDIKEIARELGIGEWEFSRTHWAVKEAELFASFSATRQLCAYPKCSL